MPHEESSFSGALGIWGKITNSRILDDVIEREDRIRILWRDRERYSTRTEGSGIGIGGGGGRGKPGVKK